MSLPFERSYWIVPGRILAGNYPLILKSPHGDSKLKALLEVGIRCFIDLTHNADVDYTGAPLLPYGERLMAIARPSGIEAVYHRCQIVDEGVPSKKRMRAILDIIDHSLAASLPVYVHCWGGRGRTGTVVGCWLARNGIASGEVVLSKIQELRRKKGGLNLTSPPHPHQRKLVCNWQAGE